MEVGAGGSGKLSFRSFKHGQNLQEDEPAFQRTIHFPTTRPRNRKKSIRGRGRKDEHEHEAERDLYGILWRVEHAIRIESLYCDGIDG